MRGRLATLARYLSNDNQRDRMLVFIDDKSDVATSGPPLPGLQQNLGPGDLRRLGETWSLRERARMHA